MRACLALVTCSALLTQCTHGDLSAKQEARRSTKIERDPTSVRGKPHTISGELLIMFRPDIPEARRQMIHEAVGTQPLRQLLNGRIAHVKIRQGQAMAEVQAAYEKFSEVEAVEPNYSMEILKDEGPAQ